MYFTESGVTNEVIFVLEKVFDSILRSDDSDEKITSCNDQQDSKADFTTISTEL